MITRLTFINRENTTLIEQLMQENEALKNETDSLKAQVFYYTHLYLYFELM